ncbi:PTS sugar transporter subunit IIA [Haloimpatiens sp. FM7330]|uniref:PTS sugar transporter subunit IIA n=1 Tax=Haloimpatiens sp. FM7330 TaxID=3298610 RepID=UPI0036395356
MVTNSLINKELILLDFDAKDKFDLLSKLSSILIEKSYVKPSFENAVIEREKVFPTGLITEGANVAIPHTDAIHVIKPTIVFAKLKNPITFKEMGLGKKDINSELIFMLAINNPKEQVSTLSNLMSIFSNKELLSNIKDSNDVLEILNLLTNALN